MSDQQNHICGLQSTLVKQLNYIEANIDLGEYHIYRDENEDFFKSKKDERSNREMLMVEKPYNL
ncbi:hypothetical protein EDD21DRAFT_419887 [Dissophora ornata]|nr:hypothetical protein EDD21DRAFT_419887 [Dissophora ornata]